MNTGGKTPTRATGMQRAESTPRHPVKPRPCWSGVVQPKSANAPQAKQSPTAPPAYRPQPVPKVLQAKMPVVQQPVNLGGRAPSAPPVYRAQTAPQVVQTKSAGGQPPVAVKTSGSPVAPPVYRPSQEKNVQLKSATAAQTQKPLTAQSSRRPEPTPRHQKFTPRVQAAMPLKPDASRAAPARPSNRLPNGQAQTVAVAQASRVRPPRGSNVATKTTQPIQLKRSPTPMPQAGTRAGQHGAASHVRRGVVQPMMGYNQTSPNPTDQLMFEYGIHNLQPNVMKQEQESAAEEIIALVDKRVNKVIDDKAFATSLTQILEQLRKYMLNQNPVTIEAWEQAVTKTRSSKYSDVASKFAYELRRRISSLQGQDPRWSTELGEILCDYINKHHILLKSIYPSEQIESGNLLHAGIGEQGHTNTPLHKAMHVATSLNPTLKPHYSKMDSSVTPTLQNFVNENKKNPYEFL